MVGAVPIPGSPLRYTMTYLIAAGSGLVVVDPGWDSEAGWQALAEGLKAAGALPADVTAWQVTQELSWSRGWSSVTGFMRRAALAEAAAHLRHLADAGHITQIAAEPELYSLPDQP